MVVVDGVVVVVVVGAGEITAVYRTLLVVEAVLVVPQTNPANGWMHYRHADAVDVVVPD